MLPVPAFWQTDLDTLVQTIQSAKTGQATELCRSAGGRPVWALSYGPKQNLLRKANYSSACGAGDRNCYAPLADKTPVVILLGAVHGGETEGTAALMNLISLLETGLDLAGAPQPDLLAATQGIRLVIAPICNPDGRARVTPPAMIGATGDELRYWMQGTWKDGSLCGWPQCKTVHPILDHVDFLGGYYNDQGINLMHDNFFRPMAPETQALLNLCDDESADWILHLHGGSNSSNDLLQPRYVTLETQQAVQSLAKRCNAQAQPQGLPFNIREIPGKEQGPTPPTFNLVSAIHHICGGVSAVFESNQHIVDQAGLRLDHEQIYKSHRILFENCFKAAKGE